MLTHQPSKRMVAPFKNLVFTSTGLEPELTDEISGCIADMGGVYKRDLMSDLTHMLVADRYTEKFIYSVKCRPDVAFIRPAFIYEFYSKWSNGLDFDIDEEFENGRLKVFEGVHLTITNVDESERKELIDLVQKHAGKAGADLRRQTTNYLITPKAKGKKYEAAVNWKIPVLRPEWIRMSIKRGAMLGEEFFTLDLPDDEVGKHAVQDWSVYDSQDQGKGQDESKMASRARIDKNSSTSGIHRKLRADPSNTWNSILGGLDKSKSTLSTDTEPIDNEETAWDRTVSINRPPPTKSKSNNEMVAHNKASTKTDSYLKDLKNHEIQSGLQKGIFSGVTFMCIGFDKKKTKTLKEVIMSHHGIITEDDTDVADFVVVSSVLPVEEVPSTILSGVQGHVVTEWMIERSLHKKKLTHDIWSTYAPHKDLKEFKNINISISGFSGIELLHLERLISLVGAQYQPVFVESRDLLVSVPKSKKFPYALEWNVPIVNVNWLWQCAIEGRVLPLDSEEYVLDGRQSPGRTLQPKVTNASLTTRLGISSSTDPVKRSSFADDKNSGRRPPLETLHKKDSIVAEVLESEYRGPTIEELPHKRRLIGRATSSSLPASNKDTTTITDSNSTNSEFLKRTTTHELSESSKLEDPNSTSNQQHVLSQVSYLDSERLQERSRLFQALGEAADIETTEEEEEMRPAIDILTPHLLAKPRRRDKVT